MGNYLNSLKLITHSEFYQEIDGIVHRLNREAMLLPYQCQQKIVAQNGKQTIIHLPSSSQLCLITLTECDIEKSLCDCYSVIFAVTEKTPILYMLCISPCKSLNYKKKVTNSTHNFVDRVGHAFWTNHGLSLP